MSLVHNERVKLIATALNNTAIATIVTGVVAPIASVLYGIPAAPTSKVWWIVALAWLAGGTLLHVAAQIMLGSLKP